MADALTTERLDELEATALNSGAKRHIADWSPDPVRDYVSRLEAFARETAPMADELAKIAADVGEDGDPFAAWESIEALKASARRLPEVERELAAGRLKVDQYHREFWEVEAERQAVCLALEHHSNSGTPVSCIAREVMARLNAAEARATAAEAEVARLREALAPFRAVADQHVYEDDDDATLRRINIRIGDLRRARTNLETPNG